MGNATYPLVLIRHFRPVLGNAKGRTDGGSAAVNATGEDVDEGLFERSKAALGSPTASVAPSAIVAFKNCPSKFKGALLVETSGGCVVQFAHAHGLKEGVRKYRSVAALIER